MKIIDQIEYRYGSFRDASVKPPKNLVLTDWQLTQLIGELSKVTGSEVTELDSFRNMRILKLEETMFIAM